MQPAAAEASSARTEPTSICAATKLAQEHLLRAWASANDCQLTVLRIQNAYGLGQALDNPYTGVLSIFVRQALEGLSLQVYEDGDIVRDVVHVEDVASAVIRAVASPPAAEHALDIGSGSSTTILEVARRIAELAGSPEPVVTGAFRHSDVRADRCSIDRARVHLGYEPRWSIEDGLAGLVEGSRGLVGRD